jgi:hypothetical protein
LQHEYVASMLNNTSGSGNLVDQLDDDTGITASSDARLEMIGPETHAHADRTPIYFLWRAGRSSICLFIAYQGNSHIFFTNVAFINSKQ